MSERARLAIIDDPYTESAARVYYIYIFVNTVSPPWRSIFVSARTQSSLQPPTIRLSRNEERTKGKIVDSVQILFVNILRGIR